MTAGSFLHANRFSTEVLTKTQTLLTAALRWSLSAMFLDLNGDGAPDLYVCGDLGSPDACGSTTEAAGSGRRRESQCARTSWF